MELMELVDNEPTARPFQCDWVGCKKVRAAISWSCIVIVTVAIVVIRVTYTNAVFQPEVRPPKALPDTYE